MTHSSVLRQGMSAWLAIACLANALPAIAQTPGATKTGPLSGMSRMGESCLNGAAEPLANSPTARPSPPDLSCLVRMENIRDALVSGKLFTVDTRLASEFQRFNIPGSANLTIGALQRKAGLHRTALLLVGDGKHERESYAACGALKRAGFQSVQVLAGGVVSYVRSGLPVQGRPPHVSALAALEASELWAEARFNENLVVVADESSGYSDHLPGAVSVPALTPAGLAALTDRHRRELKKTPVSIVLVTPKPLEPKVYDDYALAAAPATLLVYADRVAPLAKFVATQKTVWDARARGPKRPRCG